MIMVEYDRNLSHSRPSHYQPQPRDPHFQHLDHHSAPSTPSPPCNYANLPSFAPQQQSNSVRSTPTSYPSPGSYPSPSMPAYSYAPQPTHHSPHSQPMNGSNYSLPPIRMTPPNSSLPPPMMPSQSGSSLPPPGPMYYNHGHGLAAPPISHITSSPQPLRYPLPQVTPERIMSGGRHKKEIKRRTKTGCLTCRKRRIKCDEAHPTCKNCAKSKRECMGYDPIFKTQPGPAAIQPAPASGGNGVISSAPATYPNTTVGSMVYQISTAGSSPASSCEAYDYPVDPQLEASSAMPTNSGGMNLLADTSVVFRTDLKRSYDRASPLSFSDTPRPSTTPMGRSVTPNNPLGRDSTNPAKRIKIDDLLTGASNGIPLTPPSGDQSSQPLGCTTLYRKSYARLLDSVLETGWFQTKGMERVYRVGHFKDVFENLISRLQARGGTYIQEEIPNLGKFAGDAAVLLESVKLIYGTRTLSGDNRQIHDQEEDYASASDIASRNETIKRIAVVEALLTGRTKTIDLGSPQVSPKSSPPQFHHPIAESSVFWRHLARFVSLKEGSDSEELFDAAIKGMKSNQGLSRIRVVLCTIAEARHYYNRIHSQSLIGNKEERNKVRALYEGLKDVIIRDVQSCPPGASTIDQFIRRISSRALMLWNIPPFDDTFLL